MVARDNHSSAGTQVAPFGAISLHSQTAVSMLITLPESTTREVSRSVPYMDRFIVSDENGAEKLVWHKSWLLGNKGLSAIPTRLVIDE
jgi:hypothetical protein